MGRTGKGWIVGCAPAVFEYWSTSLANQTGKWEILAVFGSDIEAKSIKEARQNILAAGVDDMVRISQADFRERTAPKEPGTVIINPPYGERIRPADLELMYKEIGDTLKQKYSGYAAWILSSNPDAIKKVGLKAAQRLVLFNAALECRFLKYELYSGSQQPKKEDPDLWNY